MVKILFISPRVPFPPTRGDQLRAYHQLRVLARRHEIVLICAAESPPGEECLASLREFCCRVEVVPLSRRRSYLNMLLAAPTLIPFQVAYYRSRALGDRVRDVLRRETFDLTLIQLLRMLPYAGLVPRGPRVLDMVDALSLNMRERARRETILARGAVLWEYWKTRRLESRAGSRFDEIIVTSPRDRDALPGGEARVVPNGVDLEFFSFRGDEDRGMKRVVLTGNMGYFPNFEAAKFFLEEIWPRVRRGVPAARLQLVGDRPPRGLLDRCRTENSVEATGFVEDLRPYLWGASVAVSPLRAGSGMPNKVLEAMATGTPVVTTPAALAAIDARPGLDLLVATDPEEFAHRVIRLLKEPQERMRLAASSRRLVEERYSWEASVALLEEILERACRI